MLEALIEATIRGDFVTVYRRQRLEANKRVEKDYLLVVLLLLALDGEGNEARAEGVILDVASNKFLLLPHLNGLIPITSKSHS